MFEHYGARSCHDTHCRREGNRAASVLRPVSLSTGYNKYAEGSCLVEMGDTVVICTASVLNEVPRFLFGA